MKNTYDIQGQLAVFPDKQAVPSRFSGSVDTLIAQVRPVHPLYVIWPDRVAAAVKRFNAAFPGEGMFAAKANPDRTIIQTVYKSGMHTFDAASIEEVRLVRKAVPEARICFMHPVKAPEAIHEAYHVHGVRTFVVDYPEEVYKIMRETGLAPDLMLFVRLALPPNESAQIDFSGKFGAPPDQTVELLQMCRPVSARLGLAFHVGTQAADPESYARAIRIAAEVISKSGVEVDCLNIGGGFPVSYAHHNPPPIEHYMKVVTRALSENGLNKMALMAEPGRYLVADASALIVRVEQRRGDTLYLNDGTYGGLFDAGPLLNMRFPVRAVRPDVKADFVKDGLKSFHFAGPTCDSLDMMEGPFDLPANIKAGDWIEIGKVGAYSHALRTNFNGFGRSGVVYIKESPVRRKLKTSH